jgi:hypothetical protein
MLEEHAQLVATGRVTRVAALGEELVRHSIVDGTTVGSEGVVNAQ